MLSISAMAGGQGGYYIGLAREEYYLEGGEPPGQWVGEGAERLGLSGMVDKEAFLNVFNGFTPEGEALVQNAGDSSRRPGWDLTFSAPKSVSILWGVGGSELRQALQEAHFQAVKEALSYLEEEVGYTRSGHAGKERDKASLVIATFQHGTSRAQDPQLHTHALVMNMAVREDGTTGAVVSKPIYQSKMTAGALYRAVLAEQLVELGFAIEKDGTSFRVKGVPQGLEETFSKRRAEIEEALNARGEDSAAAAGIAALDTRTVKEHIARETLTRSWAGVAAQYNVTEASIKELRGESPERDRRTLLQGAVADAKERLTKESSHFGERDLIRVLAEEGVGRGVTASLARTAARYIVESGELVELGKEKWENRYTTRELWELEKGLLENVRALKVEPGASVWGAQLDMVREGIEAKTERVLSKQQREALSHITGEEKITCVAGMAGTGKTFLLDVARTAWEDRGLKVIGATIAAKAARGLEQGASIESQTITRLMGKLEQGRIKLDAETVLVVDEAGMLGTRDMARVVSAVRESGAKLVLVGDAKQLQPVEVGGPFQAIEREIGAAKLTEIVRQKKDGQDENPFWRREAVTLFSEGRAKEGLAEFEKRGFLKISDKREEAMKSLVETWGSVDASQDKKLIFTGTNDEAKEVNRLAQAERRHDGELGVRSVRVGGETIFEKDRLLVTRNEYTLGVSNGDLGTVKQIDPISGEMVVKLDDGRTVSLPYRHFEDVALGYAVTTHKGQGVTVDTAFVLCSGKMSGKELSYVQGSRAREDTHFFTERLTVWDAEEGRRVDKTVEELSRRMSQNKQKDLAHDVFKQKTEKNIAVKQNEQEMEYVY